MREETVRVRGKESKRNRARRSLKIIQFVVFYIYIYIYIYIYYIYITIYMALILMR
ncbi:hypothetical protein Sjap_014605 [Stephania japonica]|uniref:Uncharacterized protein n=1 Tax=Stephania japonica TaxID=461633 RepID=A0AAP0NQL0_9MAGN